MVIITGPREIGKTSLCQRVVAVACQAGWQAGGVLSPARLLAGQKVGIDVEDVRSGQRRQLAQRRTDSPHPNVQARSRQPGWTFDPAALAWGNQVLQQAPPCDLLVVDELGPLELEQGKGWQAGLHALDEGDFRLGLVVIRPELIELAKQRWPQAKVVEVMVNRAELDPNEFLHILQTDLNHETHETH